MTCIESQLMYIINVYLSEHKKWQGIVGGEMKKEVVEDIMQHEETRTKKYTTGLVPLCMFSFSSNHAACIYIYSK